MKQLTRKIEELLKQFDDRLLDDTISWAFQRKEALSAFRASPEFKALKSVARYEECFRICGGKTWFNIIDGRAPKDITGIITRSLNTKAEKRNYKIVEKLVSAGVSELIEADVIFHNDGFNGLYVCKTDTGDKYLTISTIFAGGYNIQCGHLRVLTKIK
ncbi:hypothetical protein KNT64_gp005 [Pseudomonas phage PspYZU05]|uniref:Uncharacterized protein n=1 Tax=Pseudomonas phage PspYZU05 TaxID=1983556 RepID=A0A2U7NMX3_9CAUD|nr:hypothetical protein KNT64_gp005 [Pseudomonas phage PspYZU05]ASD51957.1 hypothetical protein PspYZU05_05 [Pseudomonas phage PspYZU05]